MALAIAVMSCSSVQKKWALVQQGESRSNVIKELGKPDLVTWDGDDEVLVWGVDSYTGCGIRFDRDKSVKDKECRTNEVAQARDAEFRSRMLMQMQQSAPRAPAYQPMQTYQPARPTQTNCQTRWVGGTAYSDCSSHPTGVDTSIYQR